MSSEYLLMEVLKYIKTQTDLVTIMGHEFYVIPKFAFDTFDKLTKEKK